MNETTAGDRRSGSGSSSASRSSSRSPGPARPGWEVLDAARSRGFTGALVFDLDPPAHVYLERGEVYLAECEGDPPIGARLVAVGALSVDGLDAGTIEVAGVAHLGRLFERVPSLDPAEVLVALEALSDETLEWVAAQTCRSVVSRPYVRHPSGVDRWLSAAVVSPPQLPAPLPPPAAHQRVLRGWRRPPDPAQADLTMADLTAASEPADARGEPSPFDDDVVIEWLDATLTEPSEHEPPDHEAEPTAPSPAGPLASTARPGLPPLEGFSLRWPSGEVVTRLLLPPPPEAPTIASVPTASRTRVDTPAERVDPDDETETDPSEQRTEQMRAAVRQTIAAIEQTMTAPSADDPWARRRAADIALEEDPFDGWGPTPESQSTMPPPPVGARPAADPRASDEPTTLGVRRGTLGDRSGIGEWRGAEPDEDQRRAALRRLIDNLRRR